MIQYKLKNHRNVFCVVLWSIARIKRLYYRLVKIQRMFTSSCYIDFLNNSIKISQKLLIELSGTIIYKFNKEYYLIGKL